MEGYILGKLADERFTDVAKFAEQRQFDAGFEEELQQMAQRITGVNLAACSWSTCVNELIKWGVQNNER